MNRVNATLAIVVQMEKEDENKNQRLFFKHSSQRYVRDTRRQCSNLKCQTRFFFCVMIFKYTKMLNYYIKEYYIMNYSKWAANDGRGNRQNDQNRKTQLIIV